MTVHSDTSEVMQSLREYRAIREEILRDHRGCFEASQSELAFLRELQAKRGEYDHSSSGRFFARLRRDQRVVDLFEISLALIALLLLWRVIASR
ncbi:MAG: hypothetical protein RI967_653 [Planctomycetota bacterium]|jgi:hypothetical protein